jgi:hypothetical protein
LTRRTIIVIKYLIIAKCTIRLDAMNANLGKNRKAEIPNAELVMYHKVV